MKTIDEIVRILDDIRNIEERQLRSVYINMIKEMLTQVQDKIKDEIGELRRKLDLLDK